MAYTALDGVQSDNSILSNRRVIDMAPAISLLDPDQSQFTTILRKLASSPAFSQKVEWLEDQYIPTTSTLAASATSAAGTLSVATSSGQYFRLNDICRIVSTGEAVAVSATPVTDTVGVSRGLGGVTAASAASGGDIVILGNAAAEGASLGVRKISKQTAGYNYCQIQRNSYGFTNTLAASKLYGGPEPKYARQQKAVEHKRAIERLLFFGARKLDTGGTQPIGYTGGAFEFISSNVNNPAGAMAKTALDSYLRTVLAHGEIGGKVLFASPLVAQIISNYVQVGLGSAWGTSELQGASTKFGVQVDGFVNGAYGANIPVIVKREWSEFAATTSGYGSWAFVLDMSRIKFRALRDTVWLGDRQANDSDSVDEEYLTEFSLQFQNEAAHAVIKGATS